MEKTNAIKVMLASAGAWLGAKLGILYPVLAVLVAVMVLDQLTGLTAAGYNGQLKSRKGIWGIVKKLLYGVIVAIAIICDWTIITVADQLGIVIPLSTFFGMATSIWLIFNELISIGENLIKLEMGLPPFLVKFVNKFKGLIESQGDKIVDSVDLKTIKNKE